LSSPTVADCGERALIARISQRLATAAWVVIGPGDDAAAIEPVRGALEVLTTDAQVEGVHFDRRFVPPDAIGHRALAVNLSDLAAMGARPRAALLSMALPASLEITAFDQIIDGLLAVATRYGVTIIGGNITQTPGPMILDVTAIGTVHRRKVLTRARAMRSTSRGRWETPRQGSCGYARTLTRPVPQPAGISDPTLVFEPASCSDETARQRAAWISAMGWQMACVKLRRPHQLESR
jgi:hypothetical protein